MQTQQISRKFYGCAASLLIAAAAFAVPSQGFAAPATVATATHTYADLADFVDPADVVVRAKIRKQATVEPERSPGLRRGWVRLYIEARTQAVLAGREGLGESLRYLVDVPLEKDGGVPRIKGDTVILFAYTVPRHPLDLQLVAPDAQLPATEALEARLAPILADFFAVDAPPPVTGVRDVLWVQGNLAGESETQLFLSTAEQMPALISVIRRPGARPAWGISWSELVDEAARPPAPETLTWYRLACTLPAALPQDAHLSYDPAARARAEADYELVMRQLGPCPRARR